MQINSMSDCDNSDIGSVPGLNGVSSPSSLPVVAESQQDDSYSVGAKRLKTMDMSISTISSVGTLTGTPSDGSFNSSNNSTSMNSSGGGGGGGGQKTNEPDPDAIKMFVGQVPRSMDENDLRKMFEDFGPVFQLNVLRDKVTGQSKGCCFVTFYARKSALEAQNALHNIKTMPGMQHPIQMKPADSEKRNEERKLFIGMLSKKCTENDVRMMFSPFGQIEELTVLREQNGQSKGCAFVTYTQKQCAQNAIKSMHHSQTMEGCRLPLVVKFADTQKEKEMKKLQQANSNLLQGLTSLGGAGSAGSAQGATPSLTPQYLALLQQAAATMAGANSGNTGGLGNLGNLGNIGLGLNALQIQQILGAAASAAAALQNNPGDVASLQNLQNLQGLAALAALATGGANNPADGLGASGFNAQNLAALQQLAAVNNATSSCASGLSGLNSATGTSTTSSSVAMGGLSAAGSSGTAVAGGGLGSPNGLNGQSSQQGAQSAVSQGATASSNSSAAGDPLSQAYTGIQQYAGLSSLLGQASFPNAFNVQTAAQLQQAAANSPAGKQTEGPDGANLFIYHLPQEFTDQDLLQMFLPFGTVVSAKVFIDKQTNLSKCFGFVSFDNSLSANAAIQAMNGFQIGMKRLKVQLKRPKSENKPY